MMVSLIIIGNILFGIHVLEMSSIGNTSFFLFEFVSITIIFIFLALRSVQVRQALRNRPSLRLHLRPDLRGFDGFPDDTLLLWYNPKHLLGTKGGDESNHVGDDGDSN